MADLKTGLSALVLTLLIWRASGATVPDSESSNNSNYTETPEELPLTVSVVLLGRRGAGITSTVRQLLGPKVVIHSAEVAVASTDTLEYTLRVQGVAGRKTPVYLKLIDVPGFELADNLEHDAEILSTLKSYLHDKGLPTFFLVVYRFDDKGFAEPNSSFRQLLKQVEHFQEAVFRSTPDNVVFLLTRLFSEPPEIQQNPNARIEEFRRVIQESTSIQSPIEIIVGDNKPDESTVQMEKGFIKLPNGELYPKNILDKFLQVAERSLSPQENPVVKALLQTMIDNRESAEFHTQEVVAHATDEDTFESDLEAFEYLLRQSNVKIPKNDIQHFLDLSYQYQDAPTQIASSAQLLALQICLRNMHLESIQQLPQTLPETVQLLQKDAEGVLTFKYSLFYLKQALHLEVPEYPSQNLIAGLGYDLINDRLIQKTPFQHRPSRRPSSSLGYQFPDYMECEKLTAVDEMILANSTDTNEEYQEERLKYLTLPDREDVVISQLKGRSKQFLNLNPAESRKLVAAKEIRILECKISVDNDSIAILDESFVSFVNMLPSLNTSCAESIAVWKLLFHLYGTHVVVKHYGGGCYRGTLVLPGGENSMPLNRDNIGNTLTSIVNFGDLSSQTKGDAKELVYQFHVDQNLDYRASYLNLLDEQQKNEILNEWKGELNVNFEMLSTELELVTLSQLVHIVNSTKGADAVAATKLVLQGKLETVTQTGTPHNDAEDSHSVRIAQAKRQADSLHHLNAEKTVEKLNKLNQFLDSQ